MAKTGRKRKTGERYPSGQIRPERSPALIRRIVEYGDKLGCDPRLGTVMGRMLLAHEITAAEFDAAERYGELVGRVDKLKGYPVKTGPRSPGYEAGYGRTSGYGLDPSEEEVERIRRTEAALAAAEAVLKVLPLAKSAIYMAAVEDRLLPSHEMRLAFVAGARALEIHWRSARGS